MVNTAKVGRFDGVLKEVPFNDGETIGKLLEKADLTVGSGENVNDDSGALVQTTDQAEDGEIYYIVGNYKQGNY